MDGGDDASDVAPGEIQVLFGKSAYHGVLVPQLVIRARTIQGLEKIVLTQVQRDGPQDALYDVRWECRRDVGMPDTHNELILQYVPQVVDQLRQRPMDVSKRQHVEEFCDILAYYAALRNGHSA